MTSAKEWFKNANGKRVEKFVMGVQTVEDWDDMIKFYESHLVDQGVDPKLEMEVSDNGIEFSNGQFVMKPKMERHSLGVLTVRSKDYYFKKDGDSSLVYGEKKGAKVVDGDLVKAYDWGTITFKVEK